MAIGILWFAVFMGRQLIAREQAAQYESDQLDRAGAELTGFARELDGIRSSSEFAAVVADVRGWVSGPALPFEVEREYSEAKAAIDGWLTDFIARGIGDDLRHSCRRHELNHRD